MLAALLLAGIVAAPLGTAALLARGRRRTGGGRRTDGGGWWPSTRRLVFAVAGTVVLAGVVAGVMHLLGVGGPNTPTVTYGS
jgi:hypothetical protein